MSIPRFGFVWLIFGAATVAWLGFGARMSARSAAARLEMGQEVKAVWGAGLVQKHVLVSTDSGVARLTDTVVAVDLQYAPQRRGLLWHRTYDVKFALKGMVVNEASTAQNVRVRFVLPEGNTSYENFRFALGDEGSRLAAVNGAVETWVMVPAGGKMPLVAGYEARGMDRWGYAFEEGARVRDFELTMVTDFEEISFPATGGSPRQREKRAAGEGWHLVWKYEDVIDARDIAMDMPAVLNPGPVTARITYFAPLSLLLFFGAMMITGALRGVSLHPVTYGFLAAGFFSFHLLLGYLVDWLPLVLAFVLAGMVSMGLVGGYVQAVAGRVLSLPALVAQGVYLVLFSSSFFFEGFVGLALTLMGIMTLALLMRVTAGVDWDVLLRRFFWRSKSGIGMAAGTAPLKSSNEWEEMRQWDFLD